MSDELLNEESQAWKDDETDHGQTEPHQRLCENSSAEGGTGHVINMELSIDITLGKRKVGNGLHFTGKFAKVNWGKLEDIKVDVKSVLSTVCDVDASGIDIIESIPDDVGIQHPSLLIILPVDVISDQLALCQPALENYFEFLSDPDAQVKSVLIQPSQEVNETIRKIARDCCVRRGGRSLPCGISISNENFTQPVNATMVVAKVVSPITTGEEVSLLGKANGFLGHAQILHFIQDTVAETKKGPKEKKKHCRIWFDNETFLAPVLNMAHVTETRYVLTVAECTEGKKKWWKLRRIRQATECLSNAG